MHLDLKVGGRTVGVRPEPGRAGDANDFNCYGTLPHPVKMQRPLETIQSIL
jgi:hypothetical protein